MDIKVVPKIDAIIDPLNGERIVKKRVTAYARVSTDLEEQKNSFESQKKYYKEKILKNPEWTYVDLYADEGISGTQDFKRTSFLRMIDDALNGKIDLILTKSISRFARNTVDTLKYVRLLRNKKVGIIFEEENINTLDMSGELMLTILSSVAQQESETLSNHVKLGNKMKVQRGELVGFNHCLGYRYNSKENTMTIIPEEADLVKMIFKWYLDGYGSGIIAKKLTEMKAKTARGKVHWTDTTVLGILHNEKYIGDALMGKTYTIDPISHKRVKNFGEEDKFYIKGHHEPIIDKKDYDAVQELLNKRKGARATGRRLGNISRKGVFSSRLKCAYCGTSLSRKHIIKNSKHKEFSWECTTGINFGKTACVDSKVIKEEVIKKAFVDAFRILTQKKELNAKKLFDEIRNAMRDSSPENKIKEIDYKIEMLENKKKKALDLMIDGTIDNDIYSIKLEELNNKIENYNKEKESYILLREDDDKIERGINKIIDIVDDDSKILESFDEEVFDGLVDYVIIGGYDESSNIDSFMIRFICKTNFSNKLFNDEDKQKVINSNKIPSEDYVLLLDFKSDQHFYYFDRVNGKREKKLVNYVRVRVEIEI